MLPVAGGGRGRGHEILLAGAGERRHYPRGFCPLPFLAPSLRSHFCHLAHHQLRVCLVSHFTQKKLGFGLSFYRVEQNIIQTFWQEEIHKKFGILDGIKHTHENFGILHFIIPK
jgi:hypothetical protein